MKLRKWLVLCLLLVDCKKPEGATSLTSSGSQGPSDVLLAHWNPPANPTFYVYANLGKLSKFDIFRQSLMALTGGAAPQQAIDCIVQSGQALRDGAFAGADGSQFGIITFERESLKRPPGDCIKAFGGAVPSQNRKDVYEFQSGLVALLPNAVLIGSRPLVEASVMQAVKSPWPKNIALGGDQQLVFSGTGTGFDATAWLSVSASHFGASLGLNFSNEVDADAAADAASSRSIELQLSELFHQNTARFTQQFLSHWHVQRQRNTITFGYVTNGPAEQVRGEIAVLSAIGIDNLRRHLNATKVAEAREALRAIADHIVAAKPRALGSLPPVPGDLKMVKGMKYKSGSMDWFAWRVINFSMRDPQYFQYQMEAEKDLLSAKIIAQGDLNGDGKTSLFTLEVKMDPKTGQITPSQVIEERNPFE